MQADMDRAAQLRVSGETLIGCGQYAVDCVQPKCAELERICTEFSSAFNSRRSCLRDAQSTWRAILHVSNRIPNIPNSGGDRSSFFLGTSGTLTIISKGAR